ncbi:TraX family protein [Halomonas sp. MA07-2]|uniref:TraX family protein n=1 Tax=unclassified Halomonas TaxID=2609666 RepID=UPI003EE88430
MTSRTALAAESTDTTPRPSSSWTGWGQWLALATMTLDHLTRYIVPEPWGLDWVGSSLGRIAFPLFAAMVAWHGLFNTRNPLRYARRILVIGLVAQWPFMMMPRASDALLFNVCFTLAAGLAWGAWLRELLARYREGGLALHWLALGLATSLTMWYLLGGWVEYGHNGLALLPLLMLAMHHLNRAGNPIAGRLAAAAVAVPVLVVAGQMNVTDMAKSFTVATCLAALWLAAGAHRLAPTVPLAMPRRLWLAWYPGHFALIALWLWLTGGLG